MPQLHTVHFTVTQISPSRFLSCSTLDLVHSSLESCPSTRSHPFNQDQLLDLLFQMPHPSFLEQQPPLFFLQIHTLIEHVAFVNRLAFNLILTTLTFYQFGTSNPSETYQRLRRSRRFAQPFFMNEAFHQQIQHRNRILYQRLDTTDPRYGREIPVGIHRNRFHSLFPLEDPNRPSTSTTVFGYSTSLYKATRTKTGDVVCVRRIHGCIVANDVASAALQPWVHLRGHPNIVTVQEAFLCKDFGGSGDLCVISDFFPGAVTVHDQFLIAGKSIRPDLLWSLLCQMVSALSSIHAMGLACRMIDVKRILMTAKGTSRFRLACCGVGDTSSARVDVV